MPLPDAVVTIRDGALGLVPSSTANTALKFGISMLGYVNTIYQASDNNTLTSLTYLGAGGPLAEAAAISLANAGGPIYCVPVNPSVQGTKSAVTKGGTGASATPTVAFAPAVQIYAKITTAGILGTSFISFSVDNVNWSVPIATASTLQVPQQPSVTVGIGAGTAVVGDSWILSTAGAVTSTITGSESLTFTAASGASPTDAFNAVFTITTSGALGTAQFTYSLDGGITTAGPILTTGSGVFVVPNAGITVTFSGSLVAGDYFLFTTTPASYTTTDLTNAWNAVVTDVRTWGLCHVIGQASTASASATQLASIDSLLQTAAVNYRYTRGFMEVPVDATNTVSVDLAAFAASASTRVCACAGLAYMTSVINGRVLPRNIAWQASARAAQVPIAQDLGRVATGPLKQIPGSIPAAVGLPAGAKPLVYDEQVSGGLDAGRFLTARSIIGQAGFFITNPNVMAPIGSDFKWLQYGRVMDVACTALRAAAITFLNDTILVNNDGTIRETSARLIEQFCNSYVRNALGQGNISDLQISVNRTTNVLSTSTLPITLRILPLGYSKYIQLDVGFKNPNLGN
jgi:hypothetical protein